ncbi:hypothetical protein TeGR_g4395, partial [Tetraparma gracilis]
YRTPRSSCDRKFHECDENEGEEQEEEENDPLQTNFEGVKLVVDRTGSLSLGPASASNSPNNSTSTSTSTSSSTAVCVPAAPPPPEKESAKWARCKHCGERVTRTMEAIESHSETCHETKLAQKRNLSGDASAANPKFNIDDYLGDVSDPGASKLGGVTRRPSLDASTKRVGSTRVLYRVSKSTYPSLIRPREACVLQDSFTDESDGTVYIYEVSVLHHSVYGSKGHVTEECLLRAHIARPDPTDKKRSILTIISQVDARSSSLPGWLGNILKDNGGAQNTEAMIKMLRELNEATDQNAKLMYLGDSDDENDDGDEEGEGDATLEDFELLSVLGRGGFGKVMLVRHKETAGVYAMKILKKQELVRRRQVERTKTERHILEKASGHPFIVSLAYAFQTSTKLCMDFVQGGDFFTFLRKVGRMKESWAQLYVCEIALALQSLHDIGIIYRDLKPENVLLERDGHIKITDFGLSRSFEVRDALPDDIEKGRGAMGYQTRSFCGTEQYMAPEMLLQRGHTKGVDWWCLGLLMHEMITCRHPFHGGTHYDTLRNMVSKPPNLDQRLSEPAQSLLRGLLTKDASKRFGCSPLGAKELQVHKFFIGLNWNSVLAKKIAAPYIPQTSDVEDVSNFEAVFTKEKPHDSVVAPDSKEVKGGGFWSGMKNAFGNKGVKAKPKKGRGDKRVESLSQFNDFAFQNDEALATIAKVDVKDSNSGGGGSGAGLK